MRKSNIQRLPDPDHKGGTPDPEIGGRKKRTEPATHLGKKQPDTTNDSLENEPSGEWRRTVTVTNQDEQQKVTNAEHSDKVIGEGENHSESVRPTNAGDVDQKDNPPL